MANDFLPFATAGGANVLSQADWSALAARQTGYVAGVALSPQLNKTWRQSSAMAAMIGQFISDHALGDALDNGNITQLLEQFERAVRRQDMNYFVTPGGTADAITLTLDPAPVSWAELTGVPLRVVFAASNLTTAPTLNVNGLGTRTIINFRGSALVTGDLRGIQEVIYDGTNVRLFGLSPASSARILNIGAFTASGIYTPTSGMTQVVFEGTGGGAAAGGAANPSAGSISLGAPGGAATWSRVRFTAADVGASRAITIGAGGAGVSGAAGGAGGTTDIAGLLTLPGGIGGSALNNQVPPTVNSNGNFSAPMTLLAGSSLATRRGGVVSATIGFSATKGLGGGGGDGPLGSGGFPISADATGAPANGFGSGGGGCVATSGGGNFAGGAGAPGVLIYIEYGN